MEPTRELSRRDRLLAWFAVGGAPIAWTVHLLIAYGYTEAACSNRTGVGAVEEVVGWSAVPLTAMSIAALAAAVAIWRGTRRGTLPDPRGRLQFMAVAGMLTAIVFGFATVLEGVLAIPLASCAAG